MATQGKQQSSARSSAPTQKRRPSPAVYRRRRLVVLIGLLVVVALLVAGISAITRALASGSEPEAVATPFQTTPPSPAAAPSGATATPSASPTPVCDFNGMTVAAKTDKPAYGPEEMPLLTMTITNGGSAPCEVNVGTSQMEYLVMSGSDRIFSSKDCQTGGVDLIKTIQPGKSETANFPWQRNRTLEGCGAINAKPGGGGAYYTFEARLGNKTSPKAVFQLN
ncbi:hypothetical protein IG195_07005 [Arthrobacter sp. TES]|uniref:DUF4232 domain-containing protein n=1 Tax=Paenarthrobacter ureafaciens TaxID=37931 RepID=A0AAX3EJ55_PAEUR|nr:MULTISPECIES: hypothetical protein [Paenarthrobacter]AMB38923.1 hypothetical protein AUT26_00755 [Arthrobacter sp. ATCC 21022]ERI38989.1 membrane protein [Arthrobacter sp. AK-YN10]NKR12992.1 hypothetical protein [Arthrobacter sp. M5]NKR16801.1 hypothetical protein [Arthrobacter sp. M6]OEH59813.1 hypothetical protein A5N13_18265 [Arthrobacter sp. D4]OEH60042.1 hypothetical protein A5N17_01285 [Arthrobacter sp. D2]QOI64794.1 hypothetical protein IG195_07005 [Arthrobacter sp. TES]BCW82479.1